MLTHFICPNGDKVPTKECATRCIQSRECATKQIRRFLVKAQRPWTGIISTTQALNGLRHEYLKITQDYAVSIKDMTYAMFGTAVHTLFDTQEDLYEGENGVNLHLEVGGKTIVTGTYDYYDNETKTLYDYKTYGSYKVSKCLGMDYTLEDSGEFYKIGPKKNKPKQKKVWFQNPDKVDVFEPAMQLNCYRLMVQKYGLPVENLAIQAIVKDAGLQIARSRGIESQTYIIDIPFIDDKTVMDFYTIQQKGLSNSLKKGILPPACDERERWGGIRCERFCPVTEHCDYYKANYGGK